ncbi:SRPBCC domain-containing protein [Sphingomonas sp. LB-2]|uniref:SRPBCC domain-containing protein n=1 Tax=Sphingomonas caeni TaxID=2984949 RepID=UPI0022327BEC|nr:SRPBCC domain-containing protein [Sphingomonas caeni]MCW3847805.1 SRPBCC domain-containing protein [Sphingomonas caeni]
MTEPAVHSSFTLERTYPRPADAVFAALADPDKKRRWFAGGAHQDVLDYESDFRIGGAERLKYRFVGDSPIKGMVLASEGRFETIVPGRRVVTTSSMWMMDACISSSLVTMEIVPQGEETRLVCTFQGAFFEGSDGPQIREMGWNALLDSLGRTLAE